MVPSDPPSRGSARVWRCGDGANAVNHDGQAPRVEGSHDVRRGGVEGVVGPVLWFEPAASRSCRGRGGEGGACRREPCRHIMPRTSQVSWHDGYHLAPTWHQRWHEMVGRRISQHSLEGRRSKQQAVSGAVTGFRPAGAHASRHSRHFLVKPELSNATTE